MISKVCSLTRPTLADQLIQPLFNEHAIALAVDVRALRRARHEPVEEYVESCGGW
jgi:hypothetical protein